MPLLKFEVQSDYDKVVRLREEIKRLKDEASNFNIDTPQSTIKALETKLQSAQSEFNKLTNAALIAGQEMEQGFKQRIYDASKEVNDFNKQILAQKEAIHYVQSEIARITEEYRKSQGTRASSQWEEELNAARQALTEEKDALFSLTQERDNARLSLKSITEEYKYLQDAAKNSNGCVVVEAMNKETPQFFKSQEDYNHVQELKQGISELREEISNFNGSESDLDGLRERLSDMQQELFKSESSAANAAAALGSELGQKASDASQNLFSLNNAVAKQEEEIEKLTLQLNEASKELDSLKETGDYSAIEQQRAKYDSLVESLHNAENQLLNLQAAQMTASTEFNNVTEQIDKQDSVMVKMLGGYDNYKKILDQLPDPVKNVINGIQGMTGASKAFIATPLGAVIAAIVIVLQSLKTWFDSSVEGQMAFAEISGYVSGVLGQLKEIVITVGKAIFSAFKDPQKAVSDLWDTIKTNIVNRFKALGQLASHVGDMITAAFTPGKSVSDAMANIKDDLLQLGTGVENLTDKMGKYIKNVNEAAKANARLAKEEKQLEIDEHEWRKRAAELNKIKANAQGVMYDTSKSSAERKKALAELEAAMKEQYDKEREFADKRIAIQEERMSLTTNGIEDENKLRDLQAARLNLDAREAQEIASLQRRKNGITNAGKSETNAAQKELDAQQKLADRLQKMRENNLKTEISQMEDAKEKKIATIKADYEAQKNAIEKEERELVQANRKAKMKNVGDDGLTDAQRDELKKSKELNDLVYSNQMNEVYKAEVVAMRNFLSEYGTFQQQKLAITEEYAEKIRKAQTEGEKMTLAKQRDSALYKVDVSALEQRVNWGSVLGNFGTILKSQLQPTIDALKEITQTDEFKSSSIEDQSKIWEMLAKLTGENSGFNPNIFNDLANAVDDYQTSMYNLIKAQEAEASIAKEKANLEARLAKTTDSSERDHLIAMLNDLAKSASDAALLTQQYGAEVQRTSTTLNTVTTEISSNLNEFVSGLQSLTSGSLSGIWKGVESFEKVFSKDGEHKITDALAKPLSSAITKMFGPDSAPAKKLTEALGDAGLAGEIISAVFSILDILKDGIGNFIGSLIDTVLEAVNGLLKSILSLDIPMAIFNSLKDGLENILETIVDAFTLGHISSINWNGSNAKQVAETTDRLTNSNERLTHALDNLKNEINKSGGWKAISAAKEAEGTQRKINEQTAEILQTQMGYHGAHHSNAAKWNLSQADYQSLNASLSEYIAKNPNADIKLNSVGSLEDIYKLTHEQMDYIRSFNIEMWEKMITQGEYDKSEYWENYADLAGRVEDITESLKENLTQTSFDSLRSSFISSLMDMKKDANSWSDDFSEMLMASVLNARIGDLLDDDLEDFHNKWAEYSKSDSKLDAKEREELQSMWNDLTQRGLQIRDEVASFTGYDKSSTYSQSATAGYTTTISEDTGTEINGRLTSVQESHYREESLLEMSAEALQSIIKQLLDHYTIADDSRRILAECYIELVEIRKNTGAVLEPLKNIAETVEKIKKQTENL